MKISQTRWEFDIIGNKLHCYLVGPNTGEVLRHDIYDN